jgi:hypothetical protein
MFSRSCDVCWRGALVRVTHGDGHSAGALDLDVVYRGRAVKLEVKTPENKRGMTPLQLVEQARVRNAGGVAEEVRSPASALAVLDFVDAEVERAARAVQFARRVAGRCIDFSSPADYVQIVNDARRSL